MKAGTVAGYSSSGFLRLWLHLRCDAFSVLGFLSFHPPYCFVVGEMIVYWIHMMGLRKRFILSHLEYDIIEKADEFIRS